MIVADFQIADQEQKTFLKEIIKEMPLQKFMERPSMMKRDGNNVCLPLTSHRSK